MLCGDQFADNYTMRILGHLGKQATILTCSGPLKTLCEPKMVPTIILNHYFLSMWI